MLTDTQDLPASRPDPLREPPESPDTQSAALYDHPAVFGKYTQAGPAGSVECHLMVDNISCAGCASKVERVLTGLPGMLNAELNFATHRAWLRFTPGQLGLGQIIDSLTDAGYPAQPYDVDQVHARLEKERRRRLRGLGIAGLCGAQIMSVSLALYAGDWWGMSDMVAELMRFAALLLCLPVILYAAQPLFAGALRDLRARRLGMDVPVSLGIVLAFAASLYGLASGSEVYFDSVSMFVFLLLLARFVEFTLRRSNALTLERLRTSQPAMANRLPPGRPVDDAAPRTQTVLASALAVGDRVLVRAGDAVPADGIIRSGSTTASEAVLTGESRPVTKTPGDKVYAGSSIDSGPLVVEVTAPADQSLVGQIREAVNRSLSTKPRICTTADWVAGYFIAAVLGIAALTALWCYYHAPDRLLPTVISVLVVTCPCALSLATPSTFTAALLAMGRRGIAVSRPDVLDALARARHFVFDKTGTLTMGDARVTRVTTLGSLDQPSVEAIAAALESHTTHPVGRAIARLAADPMPVKALESSPGQGVTGLVDGKQYALGRADFAIAFCRQSPAVNADDLGGVLEGLTGSAAVLADRQEILAVFEVDDPIRGEALEALDSLRADGAHTTLLSGDRAAPVQTIARALGFDHQAHEQTPWDKRDHLSSLQRAGRPVVMVGDGVNDAPVLAQADISIAMGSGTQLSLGSASVALVHDDLREIGTLWRLAIRAQRIIRQNFAWAIGYNLVAIPLAVAGALPPWAAAAGMSLSSILVVLNGARAGARVSPANRSDD